MARTSCPIFALSPPPPICCAGVVHVQVGTCRAQQLQPQQSDASCSGRGVGEAEADLAMTEQEEEGAAAEELMPVRKEGGHAMGTLPSARVMTHTVVPRCMSLQGLGSG